MAVRVLIRQAMRELSPEQWQSLSSAIRDHLGDLCRGDTPGTGVSMLEIISTRRLNWQVILRRYVRDATEIKAVFTRPPRRFPHLVGIFPGRLHRPDRATVMAVIDTSASITRAMLEMIAGELDRLASRHTVIVVECDAVIQRVYPYDGRIGEIHGRGGTDLRPPFDPTLLRQLRPDVILYFTDGRGPAPDSPPSLPVLWCLTPGGRRPASWGAVISLRDQSPATLPGGPS